VNLVRSLAPEVIVVRGCGILRKEVLSTASIGAINPHYASLPAYRGVDVTEWSMLHGDPCAVSVHWVTEEVDTGAVIVTERIEIGGAKSLGDLRERCAALAVILFARALQLISTTGESYRAHPGGAGRQYFNLHPRLYRLAELRLSMCNGTDGTEGANT
jgi:methionyl-tRNA formyltransferase